MKKAGDLTLEDLDDVSDTEMEIEDDEHGILDYSVKRYATAGARHTSVGTSNRFDLTRKRHADTATERHALTRHHNNHHHQIWRGPYQGRDAQALRP